MSSVTEPVKEARSAAHSRGAKDWLDALSSGACDQPSFFRGVGDLLRRAPDAGWELLGLVDQYYRRGKISALTFGTLKTHLQGLMVGKGSDEVGKPAPQMQDEPLPITVPRRQAAGLAAPTRGDRAAAVPPASAASPPSVALSPVIAPPPSVAPPLSVAPQLSIAPSSAAAHAPSAAAASVIAPGDVLRGRYLVQGLLGQGGMGTVYAAIDQFRLDRTASDQKVALKVLHTEVIKRPRLFAELRREFQHLQSLSHPNIVRVHEFDRDGDLAFFTMEYLSGALLGRVLSAQESSELHRPYALSIVRDVGSAVAHAHARGVVHGDLNPGNIFITDIGEIRVLDFGAAHQLHRGPWISEFDAQPQIAVATPGYASCQVLEGEVAEARDDVYALACIAYVLLAGRHPFDGKTPLHARTLNLSPTRPHGLSVRQWKVLKAGLAFDREGRPADVQAWLERLDLRAAATSLPALMLLRSVGPRRRRGGAWFKIAAAAGLLALGIWAITENSDSMLRAGGTLSAKLETILATVRDKRRQMAEAIEVASPSNASTAPATPADHPTEQVDRSVAKADRTAAPAVRAASPPARAPSAAPAGEPRTYPDDSKSILAGSAITAQASTRAASSSRAETAAPGGTPIRARVELAADSLDIGSEDSAAKVIVRRSRTLRGDVSFSWWTESGTAKPGRDFVPIKSQVEHIGNEQSTVTLVIPVVVDPARRESRSFYIVIDEPSDNATLGSRTLTMVTLPGSDPAKDTESSP